MSNSHTYAFRASDCILGVQTLFIALGATVMVPLLTGMDPNVALFTAGVGTLLYQVLTKGQIPTFLGSSFVFVPATIYSVANWGIPSTLFGLAGCAIIYFILATCIRIGGQKLVQRMFPPIVTGPVIMNIGLVLSPVAINMAMGKTGNGEVALFEQNTALMIAIASLAATLIARLFGNRSIKCIPILIGAATGYSLCFALDLLDFTAIQKAPWFAMPHFVTPQVNFNALWLMLPLAFVSALEHIGDIAAIGGVTHRDFIKNPGLHRSLSGDGVATLFASCVGGPPNITYAEVTAGVAITKTFNPGIMTWASITAILLAFVGKVGAVLHTVPTPVMGGILMLLFGAITVTGLNLLATSKHDLLQTRNMTIVGIIIVIAVGGLALDAGKFAISGMGLAGIVGVILNLILPAAEPQTERSSLITK